MSTETNPPVVSPNEAPAASPLSSRRGVAILLLLCLVQFMDVLDASILNIALPSIKDVWGAKTVVIGRDHSDLQAEPSAHGPDE